LKCDMTNPTDSNNAAVADALPNAATPLVQQTGDSAAQVVQPTFIAAICVAYIACSAGLINFNKYTMSKDVFPFSVAMTCLHMTASSLFTLVLYCFTGQKLFPSMALVKENTADIYKKLLPLSVFFALSIWMSNEAYKYCSVPFLQMCKELNVVMVYMVGLLLMVESWNAQTVCILFVIMCGCTLSIHGEMAFNMTGFALQMSGQVCEVLKIILQQMVMQGCKLEPLTMVMVMSPLCLITLGIGLYVTWVPAIWVAMQTHWLLLIGNCCNAVLLNIVVASVIKYASGVSFVVCGVVKDVCIVSVAATLFGASISYSQVVGFSIAVCGVATYSIIRSMPSVAKEHGVFATLSSVLLNTSLKKTDRIRNDVESPPTRV